MCGKVNRKLEAEKVWQCPCGAAHDRDLNAARNIWSRSNPMCLPVTQAGAVG
ncbi:MAG: transposase [Thermoplasmata archaeon]|nr:transposase [Candidatus Sysuiplasma jiujiangense]